MKTEIFDLKQMEKVAGILRVIGHPIRIQVIDLLKGGKELTVNELCCHLKTDQSSISQHLAKLKLKGILSSRREGRNIFYYLRLKEVVKVMECMRNCKLNSIQT